MALETYTTQPGVPVGPRGVLVDLPCAFATPVSGTTVIAMGPGLFHTLSISPVATGVVQLWDNTAASGTVIFGPVTLVAGNPFVLIFDAVFTIGLTVSNTVVTSGLTITFRQR